MLNIDAQQKLDEHRQKLAETIEEVDGWPASAAKDAMQQLLPIHQAEVEILQAIIDAG